ncbi:unnamed protein product [Oppiella nova]|uniref:Sulfide:quinone oxidoreductase, mitochondrial n=1 Tax=Oppiella nova TaxID=334625 RepID=A0A7R9LP98_9ACAR|nr:unnamed protein product [Oppiella nova]CAG2165551.1 unnamed protein product [Oppiella nova]
MLLSTTRVSVHQLRRYATTAVPKDKDHYHLVVVGGGAGGLSIAAKFTEVLTTLDKGKVVVIEPNEMHYYQPMWTLVGAGIKTVAQSGRPMASVMPRQVKWIRDRCVSIEPDHNRVRLSGANGVLSYDFLVVAVGIHIDWNRVKGLTDALKTPGVCSNYSVETVTKTLPAIEGIKEGNAIFTFPNTAIKCAGAPQKIMYLADAYWRQHGIRDKINITYNTALGVIFGVPKYAKALNKIVDQKNINVNYRHNLVEVVADKKEAVFEDLASNERKRFKYDMLHVTPPMSAPPLVSSLADPQSGGYMSVNKETLQHVKYENIFGIGDCTNAPTSKTAAAVAAQTGVVSRNLLAVMKGKKPYAHYDGYTSCPLVTGNNKCILAEFDYNLEPLETFPIDQSKESRLMYYMKKDLMPNMYWNGLLKGIWNGPQFYRRIMHLGMGK